MTVLKTKVSLLKCSTNGDSSLSENDEETVNKILKHYENHPKCFKN